MKAVTEFWIPKLEEGIKAKAAFATEGKSPEEISTAIGEKFKYEGEKLKCFVTAVELAEKSSEKLIRIKVVKLNEGQGAPSRGSIIEDLCYITEAKPNPADKKKVEAEAAPANAKEGRGGKPGQGGRGGGGPRGKGGNKPKESPWGVSPEEKEAKLAAARQAAREKSLAGKS